ncbi:hypothetical protein XELAEV_18012848mg [Xenopus laevis]|uniref:Secreted protein n=1 Tax=Xenopus laevis TaxID=8355 RepID=A0A974HYM5_XENLA|nr:hypothetical protein XELAEV_18012848mg [Xenopus laevis]
MDLVLALMCMVVVLGGEVAMLSLPTHFKACLIQCYARGSTTVTFKCQPHFFYCSTFICKYFCVKFDRKVYLLHCKYM